MKRKSRRYASVGHPIHQAVEWQTALAGDQGLRMADIARKQGLSRARVTQVMRLLDLPKAVKKQLLDLRGAHHIRMLSERKLRAIIAHDDPTTQFQAFRRLVESAGADSHA